MGSRSGNRRNQRLISQQNFECSWFARQRQTERIRGGNTHAASASDLSRTQNEKGISRKICDRRYLGSVTQTQRSHAARSRSNNVASFCISAL